MYADVLILLLSAVLLVAIFRRLGQPVILAYLFVGMLLGPHGAAIVTGQAMMQTIGELGIVFLMFSLGLEFSLPRLLAMRKLVLGVGGLQVLLTSLLFFWLGWWWGLSLPQALVVSGTLALSSTAVVIKQLGELQQLHTRRAQLGVSVLLFQDLAVVPLLVMIPILARQRCRAAPCWRKSPGPPSRGCLPCQSCSRWENGCCPWCFTRWRGRDPMSCSCSVPCWWPCWRPL